RHFAICSRLGRPPFGIRIPAGSEKRPATSATMSFDPYQNLLRPLLFAIDAETVHHLAMWGLERFGPALRPLTPKSDPRLARTVFGITFPNPVGLGAGFDKNALALGAWEGLGFGFVEAGTITAKAQPGNPKPRVFRLPKQHGLINRMGFNN